MSAGLLFLAVFLAVELQGYKDRYEKRKKD